VCLCVPKSRIWCDGCAVHQESQKLKVRFSFGLNIEGQWSA
jgi:hypothetical protein